MANFNTHLSVGLTATSILTIGIYKANIIDSNTLLTCIIYGTIGSLLPDIDSDNSKPLKIGFSVVSLIFAFLLVVGLKSKLDFLSLIVLWSAGFLFIRYIAFAVFTKFTVHRGIMHSIPFAVMVSMFVTSIAYAINGYSVLAWLYGIFLFIGIIIHLILDEIYSINLLGIRIKKSFGSAFKFFDRATPYHYFGMYLLIIGMSIFTLPPFAKTWATLSNPIAWQIFMHNLLPDFLF